MLEALKTVVDELVGADPAALADEEAMVALWRELARMEAVVARASAAFEAAGGHQASGARSTPAWIAWRCKVARPTAARRVQLGRSLRHLPATEAAWVAGEITESQAALLAAARTPVTEAALERDEAMLVEQAKRLRVHHFARAMAYWGAHADPDGAEDGAERRRAERRLRIRRDADGTQHGEWVLDEVSGAIVANQLERIEDELFAEDWAEGTERLGKANVCSDRLRRSAAQRRADALVEMARRAGAAPAEGRRPEPLFTILVNYECFAGPICALADSTVVTP
ncbi:MAG TPA: DUF222 domain-containing protein, partial [Acidimicrobiales bacterium]|nr:DUF222 domain-containing protein [Acidimicrobiales bacterium]